MMNRQHGRERELLIRNERRNERRRPIVAMENLRRRRHSPRQFDRGFAEENETRGVVLVSDAVFAIDARPIEERIATNEERLNTPRRPAFDEFSDISLLPEADIDRDPGIA